MIKDTEPTLSEACEAIRTLLRYLGENPDREGLLETPKRVVKAWSEQTSGLLINPAEHLDKRFTLDDEEAGLGKYDQLILSRDIPFTSNCEHHMMPFTGTAHVGYIPKVGGRVVGLSKLARLVEGYSLRLQVQERLTQQIADAVQAKLNPLGVAVILKGQHSCQCNRGVKKPGSMVTSALYGVFKDDSAARSEFLDLLKL